MGVEIDELMIVSELADDSEVTGGVTPVTIHEQADEMRDGIPWHCDTKGCSPVVAVCTAVVYAAQKGVTEGDC